MPCQTSPEILPAGVLGSLVLEDHHGRDLLAGVVEFELKAVKSLVGMDHVRRAH